MNAHMDRTTRSSSMAAVFLAAGILLLAVAPLARAQWIVKSEDGQSQVKLGFLLQGRADWTTVQDTDPVGQNLYLRRARIILAGQVNPKVSFFFDTDSPNAGKGTGTVDPKGFGDVFVQDFVGTFAVCERISVDGGLILVPTSYNHLQSAATLMAMDYAPYTFIESGPMQAKVGRDTGLQARGLFAEKRVEVRLGAFQGVRGGHDANPLRFAGRVAVHPLKTAGKALFYPGTAFGKAKTLAVGAAVDLQKDYSSVHGDAYAEWPVAPGSTLTCQVDVSSYDGGDFLASLKKQTVVMVEAGGTTSSNRLGAWIQYSMSSPDDDDAPEATNVNGGLAYYLDGHRSALKLGVSMTSVDTPKGAAEIKDVTSFQLQYQVFTL